MSRVDHRDLIMQKDRHFFVLPPLGHESSAVKQMYCPLTGWIYLLFKLGYSQYNKLQTKWLVSPSGIQVILTTCEHRVLQNNTVDGIKLRGKHLGRRMDFFKAARTPVIVMTITIRCIDRNTFPRAFTIFQLGVSFREECQQCVRAILAELRVCFSSQCVY